MRIKAIDRIGTTVRGFHIKDVKKEEINGKTRTYAYVICPICKKEKWMRLDEIVNGKTVSCGCYNAANNLIKAKNIEGASFGYLTAKNPTKERDKDNGSVVWKCECECGNIAFVSAGDLLSGAIRSCGCLGRENSVKNGKKAGKFIKDNYCLEGTNTKNLTMKVRRNSVSGIKGVTWSRKKQKWVAQIGFKGKNYYLGCFAEIEDAIAVRKKAEEKTYHPFLEWYEEYKKEHLKVPQQITEDDKTN